MKLLKIITTTAIISIISCVASANPLAFNVYGVNDVNTSMHCQINDVTLLAMSEADCNKAGGKVGPAFKK